MGLMLVSALPSFAQARYTITEIGTLPGYQSSSLAYGVNNLGQVVGISMLTRPRPGPRGKKFSETFTHATPFLWEQGRMTYLPVPNGVTDAAAYDINNLGQIIGQAGGPVLWEKGVRYNLNSLIPANSGWVLQSVSSINDRGQIVGYGTHNGLRRGFILTPQ